MNLNKNYSLINCKNAGDENRRITTKVEMMGLMMMIEKAN